MWRYITHRYIQVSFCTESYCRGGETEINLKLLNSITTAGSIAGPNKKIDLECLPSVCFIINTVKIQYQSKLTVTKDGSSEALWQVWTRSSRHIFTYHIIVVFKAPYFFCGHFMMESPSTWPTPEYLTPQWWNEWIYKKVLTKHYVFSKFSNIPEKNKEDLN